MNLPLAAMIDNFVQLMAVIGLIGAIVITTVVLFAGLHFQHKREQLWHETARLALEKGQPVPTPTSDKVRKKLSYLRDARTGLILMGLGAGIWAGMRLVKGNAYLLGTVPAFIGLGLVAFALLAKLVGEKDDSAPRS